MLAMKRVIVSVIVLFYFCFSTGATVHFHYCMGELVNWSLNKEAATCGNCGMEKDDDCCKDEHKLVKNNSDQNTVGSILLRQIARIDWPHFLLHASGCYPSFIIEKDLINHSPPVHTGVDIPVRNCVFRI